MSVYDVPASCHLADVSAASSAWTIAPRAGRIVAGRVVIATAVTTANAIVTMYTWTGGVGTAVTTGAITVAFTGSAAGSTFVCAPTAANYVTAGQVIEFRSDGGSTVTSVTTCQAIIR